MNQHMSNADETQEPEEQTWLPDISSWLGGIGGNNEPAYE
nr:MAG TPA: hypothetical protein [Caudoviricetes sp.]